MSLQLLDSPQWPAARVLADAHLGTGYFDSVTRGKHPSIWIGAREGDELIGVACAAIMTLSSLPIDPEVRQRVFSSEAREIGVLKTLVVAPAARGRGVGLALTHERLRWLAPRVSEVVSISWLEAGPSATALLARCGFSEVGRLTAPFAQDSLEHGVVCPLCGPPPCACAGLLFWRSLRHACDTKESIAIFDMREEP